MSFRHSPLATPALALGALGASLAVSPSPSRADETDPSAREELQLVSLVEDCKYVSLNVALAEAFTADNYDRVPAIDSRSWERPKGTDSRKVQALLLRFKGPKPGAKDTFAAEYTLIDPETGLCSLEASRRVDKATFDAPPADSEEFWKSCNRKAVNEALERWLASRRASAAGVPQVSAASRRSKDPAADGAVRYEIGVFTRAVTKPLRRNPLLDDPAGIRAAEGASQTIVIQMRKTEQGCEVVR